MKYKISILYAIIAWFAVLTQYYLMLENRVTTISETTIRFFSFFTILTNSIVALYFTLSLVKKRNIYLSLINTSGTLTVITVYITVVGLIYQIILRHIWEPKGTQFIVDELLHSIIPLLVVVFWYMYEEKKTLSYKLIPKCLIFPILYLICILIRGSFSDFYPYPFIDVTKLGLKQILFNITGLMLLIVFISALYIKLGLMISNNET